MIMSLLQTKLYAPSVRPDPSTTPSTLLRAGLRTRLVPRPRLIERLNAGLHRKLTLISAPAGFGKTTLLSEWVAGCERPVAWLSLDESDNDPARFLAYLVAALQTVQADVGQAALAALQSPQPPPTSPKDGADILYSC
jgi:ATP/maltotriose-dependent transcriptional regulator MalT